MTTEAPQKPAPEERRRPRRTLLVLIVAGAAALVVVAALLLAPGGAGTDPAGRSGSSDRTPAERAPAAAAPDGSTAAERYGWGEPERMDDFDGPRKPGWQIYDGEGHGGNGRRSPEAVDVSDGVLTITGDSEGTTAGLAWVPGQKYGRWEGRVRAPASDPTYHALLLLWPEAENWPVGGEIDFMELLDPDRQEGKIFLHYTDDGEHKKLEHEVVVDAGEWHNWAVEWTPDHIVAYLDGEEWFRTTDPEVQPPGEMHLAIQLDWFPEQAQGPVQESIMQVDWVKQYPL